LIGRGRVKRKILIPTKICSPLVYVDMYGVSVLKKRKNSAGHRRPAAASAKLKVPVTNKNAQNEKRSS
jgi:hypothetical protein